MLDAVLLDPFPGEQTLAVMDAVVEEELGEPTHVLGVDVQATEPQRNAIHVAGPAVWPTTQRFQYLSGDDGVDIHPGVSTHDPREQPGAEIVVGEVGPGTSGRFGRQPQLSGLGAGNSQYAQGRLDELFGGVATRHRQDVTDPDGSGYRAGLTGAGGGQQVGQGVVVPEGATVHCDADGSRGEGLRAGIDEAGDVGAPGCPATPPDDLSVLTDDESMGVGPGFFEGIRGDVEDTVDHESTVGPLTRALRRRLNGFSLESALRNGRDRLAG